MGGFWKLISAAVKVPLRPSNEAGPDWLSQVALKVAFGVGKLAKLPLPELFPGPKSKVAACTPVSSVIVDPTTNATKLAERYKSTLHDMIDSLDKEPSPIDQI